MMTRGIISLVTILALACGGGERGGGAAGGGEGAGGQMAATGQMGTAAVSGRALFSGTPPANAPIDMAEEPDCQSEFQAEFGAAPRQETVLVASGGGLANVFVYVKSGLAEGATYAAPTTPVVIDQNACRYRPHVLGLMVGQGLEIRNSDSLLHNIKAQARSNRPFNISQPAAGMTTTRTFSSPEVMVALECSVHGWMNAYVGVLPHPFFAVTGGDGSFTISGLPAGTYTLEAWHERFGTQTAMVTVADGEAKTAEFTYTGS
jgi:plastocyanin